MTPTRRPAGSSNGGQYAPETRQESAAHLVPDAPMFPGEGHAIERITDRDQVQAGDRVTFSSLGYGGTLVVRDDEDGGLTAGIVGGAWYSNFRYAERGPFLCTGAADCHADTHVHGCKGDDGWCDQPETHPDN